MHTFIIAATSIDGFLAEKTDQKSTSWTSREDFQFFQKRTKQAIICVMGSTTYQTIGHPLKDRITIVVTNHPENIPNSQDLANLPPATTPGVIPATTPGVVYTTQMEPQQLVALLTENNYPELAVCGGSSIYTIYLQSGFVNTIYLTIEPVIFGTGVPLFNQSITQRLNLKELNRLNENTLIVEYGLN